jgi:SAM-dependent methyltransferase
MANSEEARSFTSGYGPSPIASYRDVFRYHRRGNARLAAEVVRYAREVVDLSRDQQEVRVLDLGCGGRGGVALPLNTLGVRATGIDYDVVSPRMSPSDWWTLARRNGIERAVKTIGRQILFDRSYYKYMRQFLGHDLRWDGLDVRTMDAQNLEFRDGSFSFVFSTAVFEHISDVEAAAREVRRVLRDGGKAYIRIHLYPSLSGGHALDWADVDEHRPPATPVPPWDHLRKRQFPPHVFLNQMRAAEFMEIFEQHFEILSESYRTEGQALLTPEIREELADWPEEDLVRRNLEVVLAA